MSTTLSNIETLTRYILEDFSQSIDQIETYSGSSVFTLSEPNVVSVSEVLVNDSTSGVTYSYDSTTDKVTVSSTLNEGDTVQITYDYYPVYSSNEIKAAIRYSIYKLSTIGYHDFEIINSTFYPDPETKEKRLIASIAAMKLEPDNKSYRLPDITVNAPNDLSREDKINKLIGIFKRGSTTGVVDLI